MALQIEQNVMYHVDYSETSQYSNLCCLHTKMKNQHNMKNDMSSLGFHSVYPSSWITKAHTSKGKREFCPLFSYLWVPLLSCWALFSANFCSCNSPTGFCANMRVLSSSWRQHCKAQSWCSWASCKQLTYFDKGKKKEKLKMYMQSFGFISNLHWNTPNFMIIGCIVFNLSLVEYNINIQAAWWHTYVVQLAV